MANMKKKTEDKRMKEKRMEAERMEAERMEAERMEEKPTIKSELMALFDEIAKKYKLHYVAAFSAQTAFFILLSFFPFMLILLQLTQYLPYTQEDVIGILSQFIPMEFNTLIINIVSSMYRRSSVTTISLSVIITIWSAAKGFMALKDGLDNINEDPDYNNYVVLRLLSSLYTIIFMMLLIIMMLLFVFGNKIYHWILTVIPQLNNVAELIINLRSVIGVIFLFCLFLLIYKHMPKRKSTFRQELPGAVFATAGWMGLSYVLSLYVDASSNFSYIYGSLTGIILVLLWLYFSMYIIFLGAEINYLLREGYLTRFKNVLK